jgi:cobalt-zinc-cadmium efflux system protein
MAHDHDHEVHAHSHGGVRHRHAPTSFGRAFAIGISLNLIYVVAQIVFGIAAHSLALLADAGHNFGDVLGLGAAWGAGYLATRTPTERYTYGMRKTSILAALGNAVFLLVAVGGITWEAIRRFSEHQPVAGRTVIWVAAVGVVINTATALLFMSGRKSDLNIKGAFLHMAADAAVSAGVVVAGFIIIFTGWHWLDPTVSLMINAVIVAGTWSLLRDSFNLSIDAVPRNVEPDQVEKYLEELPGIEKVHDLHIWAMSTTETALTAHLVKPDGKIDDPLLDRIKHELHVRFGIEHMTLQLECGDCDHACEQEPENAV